MVHPLAPLQYTRTPLIADLRLSTVWSEIRRSTLPLEAIAQLLPWGLLYHSLLPFCEAFNPDIVAPRTGPPPWTLSLEYFYQLIHPDVWTLLEFDEDCDRIACEELRRRRGAIERGEEGDAGGLRDMLYEHV
ncbi:hypothetical protein Rhopal_003384-T1 [Rhodotorula paludigena]|uniref:Uncharacterized protein n=1 Tax=Rhodotorula paludigena TaxID=86838 RepID=A0AAV5GJI8_9BASI|nr:hypothetical protein Rhopal_003384-T1 [Rhodotorula paludigena]